MESSPKNNLGMNCIFFTDGIYVNTLWNVYEFSL